MSRNGLLLNDIFLFIQESVVNTADNPEIQNYISSNQTIKGDAVVKQGTVRMKNINR